jgi:ABC-type lipoprotein export system ATPase subunit
MEPLLEVQDLQKVYKRGVEEVQALRGVTLTIGCRELVAIMGPRRRRRR